MKKHVWFFSALMLLGVFARADEVAAPTAPVADAAPPTEAAAAAAPEQAAAEAVVDEKAAGSDIGKPAAGKGRIVFFRPKKFAGAIIGFKVREGDVELGVLRNGNYFVIDVEPGLHQYVVHGEVKDVLSMEVEEGEVYYVQGVINVGVLAGRPNISPSKDSEFEAIRGKLKMSTL